MSIDPGPGLRTVSPVSSGRNSPVARLGRGHADEGVNVKDKVFRRFASGVERALSSFDTTQQEWADYISFLGRLLKALQAHPSELRVIPDSAAVGTRLAQCLDPTLPSGVHQKALEVYSHIFTTIGVCCSMPLEQARGRFLANVTRQKSNLERDLHLYLPGLSLVLSFASLTVRPIFLDVLETHFLSLSSAALRPPLKSMILCLLPGLEDESSEDFDRILSLVDKFKEAARQETDESEGGDLGQALGDSYFWQCFFLATITNPSRRQGALAYLSRQLPKFGVAGEGDSAKLPKDGKTIGQISPEAKATINPEPGLLIRCLAAGLSDKQLLVQRGFLDLLVSNLPLDSVVLTHAVRDADLQRLVYAAVGVVARRDMSLNRRLWTWLLGPEPKLDSEPPPLSPNETFQSPTDKASIHAAYFARYGLKALSSGMLGLIESNSMSAAEKARPFRLCLSLMDRWEVGGLLIPDLYIPLMHSAFRYSKTANKSDAEEVIKSASNFFDGVESSLIWSKFNQDAGKALQVSQEPLASQVENLELCSFIISRFNVREEEMVLQHMPHSALSLMVLTRNYFDTVGSDGAFQLLELRSLDVLENFTALIPDRAFSGRQKASDLAKGRSTGSNISREDILRRTNKFYSEDQGGLDGSLPPFPPTLIGSLLLRESVGLLVDLLMKAANSPLLDSATRVVCGLLLKVPNVSPLLSKMGILDSLHSCLVDTPENHVDESPISQSPFRRLAAITGVLVTLHSTMDSAVLDPTLLSTLQLALVQRLWHHLTPSSPKHHVEAVRCLWQIEAISSSRKFVEACITSLIASSLSEHAAKTADPPVETARRFSALWNHSTQDKMVQTEKNPKGLIRRSSAQTMHLGHAVIPAEASTILTRPLLVLLDSLSEDGTELCSFVKSWLQDLPTLSRVFLILISRIRSLRCMDQSSQKSPNVYAQHDDSRQCLYFMRHLLKILSYPSENTWLTLAGETADPLEPDSEKSQDGDEVVLQMLLIQVSMRALEVKPVGPDDELESIVDLQRVSLAVIQLILNGPFAAPLKDLELQNPLLQRLLANLETMDPLLQSSLLETITAALKLQLAGLPPPLPPSPAHRRRQSKDIQAPGPKITTTKETPAVEPKPGPRVLQPPPLLIECLKAGFSSFSTRIIIESWVSFLIEVLPIFSETIFQNLIPLVECFCSQIGLVFSQLKSTYRQSTIEKGIFPEPTLISLLNGLEHILACAHERLLMEEGKSAHPKSPDQPQGFFGNMVQGVFTTDNQQQPSRAATANSRLAVLLCFQDTVRACFSVWCWGIYGATSEKQDSASSASFGYTALRMRNRARRLLEHLFAAEALECLETLAMLWCNPPSADFQSKSVMGLLNVLNGSRPKHTVPAIFNAIYSRTNPNALDSSGTSSLTSELQDTDLVAFLVEYMNSVDDDAMDEIWSDCITFLKDVLANPLPHSHILPMLLEFTALLAEKVDNTNFGEQKRMRKELGDLFLRLLTATFTTRPMGFLQEPSQAVTNGKTQERIEGDQRSNKHALDVVSILVSIIPRLKLILVENERVINATNSITANVTGPTLRGKGFPNNVDGNFLELLSQLSKISQAAKFWKKDVTDALNDPRFFTMPLDLVLSHWMSIMCEYALNDKDRMPELLSKITAPTTAGIVFGVGATSARLEADRKAQLMLRRIALLIISSADDTFVANLGALEEKLVELLSATPTSSPSSSTRADVFLVLRAVVLKTSSAHLALLWPVINAELQAALLSVLPTSPDHEKYTNASILQACRLLDALITLDPDDFQLHEWLFITDTVDAVYRPSDWTPAALADDVSELLGSELANLPSTSSTAPSSSSLTLASLSNTSGGPRKEILDRLLQSLSLEDGAKLRALSKLELVGTVLRPFLGQLSLLAFEATYGMGEPDVQGCVNGLVKDLFEDTEGAGS